MAGGLAQAAAGGPAPPEGRVRGWGGPGSRSPGGAGRAAALAGAEVPGRGWDRGAVSGTMLALDARRWPPRVAGGREAGPAALTSPSPRSCRRRGDRRGSGAPAAGAPGGRAPAAPARRPRAPQAPAARAPQPRAGLGARPATAPAGLRARPCTCSCAATCASCPAASRVEEAGAGGRHGQSAVLHSLACSATPAPCVSLSACSCTGSPGYSRCPPQVCPASVRAPGWGVRRSRGGLGWQWAVCSAMAGAPQPSRGPRSRRQERESFHYPALSVLKIQSRQASTDVGVHSGTATACPREHRFGPDGIVRPLE